VVHTISEEQVHLKLYRDRMADYGVSLGAVPVSRFFWDTLADMNGPLEYLSGMSLTFEQANLDFSRHYMNRFSQLGDVETADLLRQVYEDEIGHVKLGAVWFEKLRAPADKRAFWDRYQSALRPPLTPARAQGLGFDREARLAAGLSPEFIESLQGFSHSKGRTPAVYLFNPTAEVHLAHGHVVALPRAVAGLGRDLETLPMFLAGADDAVLVNQSPRPAFLSTLRDAGMSIPEFVTHEGVSAPNRQFAALVPWAWSPDSLAAFAPRLTLQPKLSPPAIPRTVFEKSWAVEQARTWAAEHVGEWLAPPSVVGDVYETLESAMNAVDRLRVGGAAVVIKALLGSAGRGMRRVLSDEDVQRVRPWVQRMQKAQGAVVVEPWLAGVVDLSVQLVIAAEGRVRIAGITRFETDSRGQYQGTRIGRPLHGLDAPLRRFLIGPGSGWRAFTHLEEVGRFVGRALAQMGYCGPAGVDALVYLDADGAYRLKPIVEVNPRFTMGHLALRVGKRLGNRRTGRFRILTAAMAKKAGAPSLAAHVAAMGDAVLCLTDPLEASHAVAVLEGGRSAARTQGAE